MDYNEAFAFLKDYIYKDHLCPYCINEIKKYDEVVANKGNPCKLNLFKPRTRIKKCEGFTHA